MTTEETTRVASTWRHVGASVAGLSHDAAGMACQDAHRVEILTIDGREVLIVAMADGAGSAKQSQHGSLVACNAAIEVVRRHLEGGAHLADVTEATMHVWVEYCADHVSARATVAGVPDRELACTLLLAVVGDERAVFGQLGDGAIVVERDATLEMIGWPQNGQFINTTLFITDPSDRAELQVHILDGNIGEVAMLTDGLEFLALEFASRRAHTPFFAPLLTSVRALTLTDLDAAPIALADFLTSDAVRQRTDDDLTLVLASRRPQGYCLRQVDPTRASSAPSSSVAQSEASAPPDNA